MTDMNNGNLAFAKLRVVGGEEGQSEPAKLFQNMAKLLSFVSDRCDDAEIAQYDEVLCQLAELVEIEARVHVAKLLAPLTRAPATVLLKLANDDIEVARPLLEFSSVLSDDDLVDIITHRSDEHRQAIAGRADLSERLGEALVSHGDTGAIVTLVRNTKAELNRATLEKLVALADDDAAIAANLRNRTDINWKALRGEIEEVADQVLERLEAETHLDPVTAGKVNAVVYNRIRNRAGFSAQEWKLAYNQVKALADRRQLDEKALARFARFGYGHHAAAALSVMLRVTPEIVVKWLAGQDYAAVIVALKASNVDAELFGAVFSILPWRDMPTDADRRMTISRFEALDSKEANSIFDLWRAQAFRKRAHA